MLTLLLTACDPYGVVVSPTSVATVLRVTWEGDADTVRFTSPGRSGTTSGAGEALIVGLHQAEQVEIRVSGPSGESRPVTVQSGILPPGLPAFTVTAGDAAPWPMLMAAVGTPSWTYVIDEQGEVVWYVKLEEGLASTGVGLHGGLPLHNVMDTDKANDVGAVHQHAWDGTLIAETRVELGHHFFWMHDDGRLAYLQADVRLVEDEGFVVGDSLRIVHPDGESELLWSAWDHFPWNKDELIDTGFYPQGFDWTHANGLSYDPVRDSYWISFAVQSSVVEVDASTGATRNHLGFGGDWTVEGDGFGLDVGPHCPSMTPQGTLLLFDNQAPDDGTSRVLEYDLDFDGRVATPLSELSSTVYAELLGCPRRTDDGLTLSSWGSGGLVTVHDGSELVWQAEVDLGFSLGQVMPVSLP